MKTGEGSAGVSQRGRLEGERGEREGLRDGRGREEDLGSVPSRFQGDLEKGVGERKPEKGSVPSKPKPFQQKNV